MKIKSLIPLIGAFPVILIGLVLSVSLTGGSSTAANPVEPPCTPETAEKYGEICMELNVPWELVLLTDHYLAVQEKRKDIEDVNPLYAALEFMVLYEMVERYGVVGRDEDGNPEYDWIYVQTNEYKGKTAILRYIELSENKLDNTSPSVIVTMAEEKALEKETERRRYTIEDFKPNDDLEYVLGTLIGLNQDNVEKVIELYESHYLSYLYFGSAYNFVPGEYGDLPEVIVGEVTRLELAQVAASLIGHPYLLGGKYAKQGIPPNALDCSGYIDWVYFQCFGSTVGNGGGTAMQFANTAPIDESDLKIGDLGFNKNPSEVAAGSYNHVGIYIGEVDGKKVFIHCGGSYFGYPGRESGRVGISFLSGGTNDTNPLGGTFSPPIKSNYFKYYRRPQFQFEDD